MNKPLKDIEKKVNDLLHAELSTDDKAWDIIFEFYHHVLTRMEEQDITQADLARKLGKSRSAISQLLNKTPNISVIRMVEIAEAVGLEFSLTPIKSKRVQISRSSSLSEYSQRKTLRMEVNEE
ncbi:MAG: helix-turn-helix transcriptional regulator [Candidatus Marinimicrobia bacterium]|nr:helix-turn-helix transcriptional regulator [Candidatus Neomarinimicrobiota bacterium]